MGWWDTWNTVKDTAKGWGSSIWNNASLSGAATGVVNFSYNTVGRLLEQIPAVPRLARAAFNPKVTKIVKGVARITVEDVLPLALVSYTHSLLQRQGEEYLDSYPPEARVATDTALQIGLWLLWGAHWAYSTRKKAQIAVRTAVLTLEAGSSFNSIKENPPMDLCVRKKCTTLRFLKGSFRDILEYWATKAAISFIGYVPVVGGGMAAAFNIYHDGRYVITLVLPELCGPDQERYLREYPELALAHGVTHYVLTKFVTSMIEHYSGIPAIFYESTVQQFLLITQIGIASQITLPPAVAEPQRNIPDPIALYESGVGFVIDTFALGLKKKLPEMLQKQTMPLVPWEKIPDYANVLWSNKVSENLIKPVLIPRMLRNEVAFANDPVIPWDALRARIISAIANIEDVKAHPLTKLAMLSPSTTAEVARPIFGTPKFVVELLLKLMKNEEFMRQLGVFGHHIGGLHRGAPPALPSNKDAFLLRGQEKEPVVVTTTFLVSQGERLLDPRSVIAPVKSSGPKIVEITEEEEKAEESTSTRSSKSEVKLDPSFVIKKGKGIRIKNRRALKG